MLPSARVPRDSPEERSIEFRYCRGTLGLLGHKCIDDVIDFVATDPHLGSRQCKQSLFDFT